MREKKLISVGMLGSSLFRRFFFLILFTILGSTTAFYMWSVPYLRNNVHETEERFAQTILNNVYELIRGHFFAVEAYKQSVENAHQRQLKNIALFQETFLTNKFEQFRKGYLSEEEAQKSALEELRNFRYGDNDYVWVADTHGRFLCHPDPQMDGKDFSETRDVFGNSVLMALVEKAIQEGEGYSSFWWHRLGQDFPAERLAYARLFPQWEWVIGTGVFVDQLEQETILRREKMIDELRLTLQQITRDHTGEMYIFDSWKNIIIHPDSHRENTKMPSTVNVLSGNLLVDDLVETSKDPAAKLVYLERDPNSPSEIQEGSEKIAWVRYVDGFDWYIVVTLLSKDLDKSSIALRNKIIVIGLIVVLLSLFCIIFFGSRLLRPIQALSLAAIKVKEGDLTVQCEVQSSDEIGLLAASFNAMVSRLRMNIEELDKKVGERTLQLNEKNSSLRDEISQRERLNIEADAANKKLRLTVTKLSQKNEAISHLNHMAELLHACYAEDEVRCVTADVIPKIFPGISGALYLLHKGEKGLVKMFSRWGEFSKDVTEFNVEDCWALRRSKAHGHESPGVGQVCEHVCQTSIGYTLCVPLMVSGNKLNGLLHLEVQADYLKMQDDDKADFLHNIEQLGTAVAGHLSMALANIALREKLLDLSVRDGLTGLFNRRFMEETLALEFQNAMRHKCHLGLLIIDVDNFKIFNDTHGNQAGDEILVNLGRFFQKRVRTADVVCRYGGEEFVVIMPDSPLDQVVERAASLCRAVENDLEIIHQGQLLKVTISIGVANYTEDVESPAELFEKADQALEKAKELGRSQVVVDE